MGSNKVLRKAPEILPRLISLILIPSYCSNFLKSQDDILLRSSVKELQSQLPPSLLESQYTPTIHTLRLCLFSEATPLASEKQALGEVQSFEVKTLI